jgi:hypothetical protein
MTREVTQRGKLGELERLVTALANNSDDLPQLQGSRITLEELLDQARAAFSNQAAHTAAKQTASRQLEVSLTEGMRLATVLRGAVKSHYGIRAEKLAEFGIQPFRGRPAPPVEGPKEPAPPPAEEPPIPPVE